MSFYTIKILPVSTVTMDTKGKKYARSKSENRFENETYQCRPNSNNTLNPYKSLIIPLILNGRQFKGKIDTRSDGTCVNKYIDSFFPI